MKIIKLIKSHLVVEFISGLFILLFVYTAVSKFSDMENFQSVISKSPLIGNYSTLVSWGIPISELLISALLFIPKTRTIGLYSSAIIMLGFTGYIYYIIHYTPHLPCACGGVIAQMNWNQHLIFNIIFTVLAILGILLDRSKKNNSTLRNTTNTQNPIPA